MKRCYVTGVGRMYGRSHTHHRGVAGGRWKKRAQKTQRIFKPNLQRVLIWEDGVLKNVYVTTKVIKRVKFDLANGKRPKIEIVKLMPEARRQKVMAAAAAA
ncbi:MAG: hypothetical protein N2691_02765 [Patescibacteria group bacterium]|nr:hypothetical protein [Patescibacteria group bacterium]